MNAGGPSPRGRGTPEDTRRVRRRRRAIPARAGNAPSAPCRSPSAPGHPRAGGERTAHPRQKLPVDGPSPRGRGTPQPVAQLRDRRRAIPARAGNAPSAPCRSPSAPGHPRAGGERGSTRHVTSGCPGPSPRGRGTPLSGPHQAGGHRAIPARAGNACRKSQCAHREPGHPRAGGERRGDGVEADHLGGPSPRGRGTRGDPDGGVVLHRAIPARAGNAPSSAGRWATPAGHPRAGGERLAMAERIHAETGPSPRGRGTRRPIRQDQPRQRAIPARAGNARARRRGPGRRAGHPRAGGEREAVPQVRGRVGGPSPRGRGTHFPEVADSTPYSRCQTTYRRCRFVLTRANPSIRVGYRAETHEFEAVELRRHAAVCAARIEIVTRVVGSGPCDDRIAVGNVRADLIPDHSTRTLRIVSYIHARPDLQQPNRQTSAQSRRRIANRDDQHRRPELLE